MPTANSKPLTEATVWTRLLEPNKPSIPADVARFLLRLKFPRTEIERMHALAAKAREGTLTTAEREEIDIYGRVGSMLSILKSKARVSLKKSAKSNGIGA
jgi:hypothetical protein